MAANATYEQTVIIKETLLHQNEVRLRQQHVLLPQTRVLEGVVQSLTVEAPKITDVVIFSFVSGCGREQGRTVYWVQCPCQLHVGNLT